MLHKTFAVFTFQMKAIRERILMIFLLIGLFVWSNLQGVQDFSREMGIAVAPWGFPHIVNDMICELVIMAGAVALFCDAPFRSELQIYILPRAGQIPWVLGHGLYILVLSFCYILAIALASFLPFLFRLDFQLGWGKIWGTLARSGIGLSYGIPFQVNDYLVGAYKPMTATALSFLLNWVCCIWLGLLIYAVNLRSDSYLGTFLAAGFVLMDLTVYNEWLPWFYRISPVTMAQLHTLKASSFSRWGVTPAYAAGFFGISIFAFLLLTTGKRHSHRN